MLNWLDSRTGMVTLTKDFFLGATDVTQRQWLAVMGTSPSKATGDTLPVVSTPAYI